MLLLEDIIHTVAVLTFLHFLFLTELGWIAFNALQVIIIVIVVNVAVITESFNNNFVGIVLAALAFRVIAAIV
jgi:hypothetical protein